MVFDTMQLQKLYAQGAEPGFIFALQKALAGAPQQTYSDRAQMADQYWTRILGAQSERDGRVASFWGGGLQPIPGESEVAYQYRLRGMGRISTDQTDFKGGLTTLSPFILLVGLGVVVWMVL